VFTVIIISAGLLRHFLATMRIGYSQQLFWITKGSKNGKFCLIIHSKWWVILLNIDRNQPKLFSKTKCKKGCYVVLTVHYCDQNTDRWNTFYDTTTHIKENDACEHRTTDQKVFKPSQLNSTTVSQIQNGMTGLRRFIDFSIQFRHQTTKRYRITENNLRKIH
jgi:hypothetical protein